jgi:[ribosomal protein S18]-alanine N-acetyltransferase
MTGAHPSCGVRIRPLAAGDLDNVLEIAGSLPQAPQWPRSAYVAAIDPESLPRRIAVVAECVGTGAIAGFAIARVVEPEAELETIGVARGMQRSGIARRLFAALAGELRSAHVTEVTLEVRASNAPALALYRSLDFSEYGHRVRYYVDPVEDAVLMRLNLA